MKVNLILQPNYPNDISGRNDFGRVNGWSKTNVESKCAGRKSGDRRNV